MSGAVLKAKKPFLYLAAATSILKSNPYSFKSFLDYERGCEAIAKLWRSEGVDKIAHLKINIEAGERCRNGLLNVFPEFLEESFDLNQDVAPQLLRFKQKGVDRLFCAGLEGDVTNLVQIFDRLHYFPHFGVNEDADRALKNWQNPLGVKMGVTFGLPKPSRSFVERLNAAFPGVEISHPQAAGLAYLHVRQLSRSLRGCGDVECQMKKLIESPPDGDFGFEGWDREKRVAKFRVVLRQIRGGEPVEVER
jgi:Periplasmic binding protein